MYTVHNIPARSDEFERNCTDIHAPSPLTYVVPMQDWKDHNIKSPAITTLRAESLFQAFVIFWLALAALITVAETELL